MQELAKYYTIQDGNVQASREEKATGDTVALYEFALAPSDVMAHSL